MLPRQFLIQMARAYQLSPDQEEVFLLRLADQKEYDTIADKLKTSKGACLKRMGQVYNKFGFGGLTRGKENRLRNYLIELYQQSGGGKLRNKVLLVCSTQAPELNVAQQLREAISQAGYEVLIVEESFEQEGNGKQRMETILQQCESLVLLLSPQTAANNRLTEVVKQARERHDSHPDHQPEILVLRVNLPLSASVNPELHSLLKGVKQIESQPSDTPAIVDAVLSWLPKSRTDRQVKVEASFPSSASTSPASPIHLEYPGSPVPLNSPFYVERPPMEERCYQEILTPSALIRIKAPQQMGKTSLLLRVLKEAEERQGYRTINLNLEIAERDLLSSLEKFLKWFCAIVGKKLNLKNELAERWDDTLGNNLNCEAYFEEYLLAEISEDLVLGLDNADRLFEQEIFQDFFSLLRALHEKGKSDPIWSKVRWVMTYSTESYIPIDSNQSPFNIGLGIDLLEFTGAQVQDLADRHGLNWNENQVKQLTKMVGGHPYLVRLALYEIATQHLTLEELLKTAPTDIGIYREYLQRQLNTLKKHSELVQALKKVIDSQKKVSLEPEHRFKLHSMGLIKFLNNEVQISCELYRQYFREQLGAAE